MQIDFSFTSAHFNKSNDMQNASTQQEIDTRLTRTRWIFFHYVYRSLKYRHLQLYPGLPSEDQ